MTRLLPAILLALVALIAACDDGRTTASGSRGLDGSRDTGVLSSGPATAGREDLDDTGEGAAPMDFGDDWEQVAGRLRGVNAADVSSEPTPETWGIILRTFTGDDHEMAAATMVREVVKVDPRLSLVWTRTTDKGSMVVYGRYGGPDQARQDLAWIKSLKLNDRVVFVRALIGNVTDYRTHRFRGIDLLSVRRQFPGIDPLYTMQVAVWGSFDGALAWSEARKRAEGYAVRLRSQSLPAFVHHDEGKQLSMVTVGLFDRRAIDPQSGLYSPDVQAVLDRFPEHLINGEPLLIAIDGRDPNRGTKAQQPMLVVVPGLD